MTPFVLLQHTLDLLRADRYSLAQATYEKLGGHGIPGQLKRFMVTECGAVCVFCGRDKTAGELYLGHILSASWCLPGARASKRAGYLPGNIALTCKPCNDRGPHGEADENWCAKDLARPDLVPLVWPSLSWRNPIY